MIRQDCGELTYYSSLPFKKYACKLFSCFYFSEQITNAYYDAEMITQLTEELIHFKHVDSELSVYENLNGINTTKRTLLFLGVPVKDVVYRGADYICKDNEHEILKLVKPGYAHFVPGDGTGNYSWDSLGIRPQQKNYKLKSKRIIIL